MPQARDGSLRHSEGAFRIGEVVEYLSATHGRWIPAAIVGLHSDGRVSLDVKPRPGPSTSARPSQSWSSTAACASPSASSPTLGP